MEHGGDVVDVEEAVRAVADPEQFPKLDAGERQVRARLLRDGFLACVRQEDGTLGFELTPAATEACKLVRRMGEEVDAMGFTRVRRAAR